jgi:hypothetical protein
LTRLLNLIRVTNNVHGIVSAYGTNFQYIVPWNLQEYYIAITQAIIYNGCACDLHTNCTAQATFVNTDSPSENISIMGLRIGCTPTESFLSSTLACFYNSSCINLIYDQLHYNNTIDMPLFINMSRFTTDTLLIDLVNELFVENWLTRIHYSSYFDQCSPSLCSYTYIEQVNLFYTVTLLLGLYGGLSFVLKWFCPRIIRLLVTVYECRKKRKNHIEPVFTIGMVTISDRSETVVRHLRSFNTTNNSEMISTTASPSYDSF